MEANLTVTGNRPQNSKKNDEKMDRSEQDMTVVPDHPSIPVR